MQYHLDNPNNVVHFITDDIEYLEQAKHRFQNMNYQNLYWGFNDNVLVRTKGKINLRATSLQDAMYDSEVLKQCDVRFLCAASSVTDWLSGTETGAQTTIVGASQGPDGEMIEWHPLSRAAVTQFETLVKKRRSTSLSLQRSRKARQLLLNKKRSWTSLQKPCSRSSRSSSTQLGCSLELSPRRSATSAFK